MNRLSPLGSIWCLSLVLSPVIQAGKLADRAVDPTDKLREIVSVLRAVWARDFDTNYRKYMLGPSPIVLLIPRAEMMKIAAARPDGRERDGATTQGLTISEKENARIVVVYDDIAALLVAKTINHELGHLDLKHEGLSRNREEARVRKTVDTAFFARFFGPEWLQATVEALKKKVSRVEKNGRSFQGYTPEAIETFYLQLRHAGAPIERNALHDRILGHIVFILTNREEDLVAALGIEDDLN